MGSDEFSWVPCDSRSDLEARLAALRGVAVFPVIEAEDANTWGYVKVPAGRPAVLPVGYADVGLTPKVTIANGVLLLGIAELVAGIDISTGALAFRYRMPTVFHQFVRVDERGFLVQDEIGFVLLSRRGEERWRFCKDLIQNYKLMGDELVVTTFEGDCFRVKVGKHSATNC